MTHARVSLRSLPELLSDAVARFPAHVALTDGLRQISYAELGEQCGRLVTGLLAAGVRRGDRVALMLPNSIEYVIAFFAVARAGAVVTQVNPLYVNRELAYILKDSGARALLVDAETYERVRELRPPASLQVVIVVGANGDHLGERAIPFSCLLDGAPDPIEVPIDPEVDLSVIQYTGGTTGEAKGAAHTHASLLGTLRQTTSLLIENSDELPANAKSVALAPLSHIFGTTMVLLFGLDLGWNLLLVRRFQVKEVLGLIRREQPVMLAGVTAIFAAFNAETDLEQYGLDRVKLFVTGGASMPPALAERFESRTGRPIWEGYGLSEGAPVSFNTYRAGPRRGSIGIPVPGTEVRVVDLETGQRDMPHGESGELLVRGPQVMRGYWGKPDETATTLVDGWLHTGDISRLDNDGFLKIVDRMKDMINTSGYKVYPREVEDVLYQHGDVAEALVVGVPDDRSGEKVKAFVTLKPAARADAEALLDHCRTSLAPYKVPRLVEFRDHLPRSAVGKLLRRVLAEEERAISSRPEQS
jgi:long-chain acyl-CoA synthetase